MVLVYKLGYLRNYWRLAPKPVDIQNSIFDQYGRSASQLQFPSNYTAELPLVRVKGRARCGTSHCPRELGNDHFDLSSHLKRRTLLTLWDLVPLDLTLALMLGGMYYIAGNANQCTIRVNISNS